MSAPSFFSEYSVHVTVKIVTAVLFIFLKGKGLPTTGDAGIWGVEV
jgi:hypothetical protein